MLSKTCRLVVAAVVLVGPACSKADKVPEPTNSVPAPAASPSTVAGSPSGAAPKPATGSTGAGAAASAPSAGEELGIEWTVPDTWKLGPARPMRKATYSIPSADGAAPGELAIFYFGQGQGGDVNANIERWIAQFKEVPQGAVQRSERVSNDLKQSLVEIPSGTYTNTMMGPHAAMKAPEQKDFALLGAVVEAPTGKYFFKFTGPKQTVKANREAFFKVLDGIKPKTN